jgi:hypothetical protein
MALRFYIGLHQPSDAKHFARSFVSVNRLRNRKSDFEVGAWIMDSGAFTEISKHRRYREGVGAYADQIVRWGRCGELEAAVAQDYMCEPWIIERTGLDVLTHQRLTVARYDLLTEELRWRECPTYVLPVLQGFEPESYVQHVQMYGDRLAEGAWVGVGSVCKRNANASEIERVLDAVRTERPDLRLHGFGLKTTALRSGFVRASLYSADSMAWSYAARRQGRNANDWREAKAFVDAIESQDVQLHLWAA